MTMTGKARRRGPAVNEYREQWEKEKMGEWQPIETAPKDYSKILVCRQYPGGEQVGIDRWHVESKAWWMSTPYNQPILWMPLPEPPKPEAA
jgi:hypothetical protein